MFKFSLSKHLALQVLRTFTSPCRRASKRILKITQQNHGLQYLASQENKIAVFCITCYKYIKKNYHSERAVVLAAFYLVEPRVTPVKFLCLMVQREGIRHADVSGDDGLLSVSGQERSLDTRVVGVPVGPIHSPVKAG